MVYGSGAYGHAVGTLETVQTISRDDIVRLYKQYYEPRNAAFVLAGDITLEQGKTFAEKFFGDWKNEGSVPNEEIRLRRGELEAGKRRGRYAGGRPGRGDSGSAGD